MAEVLTDKPPSKRSKAEADALYIGDLEPSKSRRIISDKHKDAPRGFAFRIDPNGARSFVLRYTAQGRDRMLTIGEYGTWSLAGARETARDYRQRIDTGEDILESRRAERREPTVRDVVDKFLESKRSLKSYADLKATLHNHLVPAFGQRKIASIRRREVIELVEKLSADKPRLASLLLSYTKQVFTYAEDREFIDANPVATLNAQKINKALTTRTRTRVLDDDELAAFWARCESCGLRRLTALALQFILVSGQRPGEVAGIRESEIDGDVWTIPAERRGKTDTAHSVPLTDTARRILDAAREETERLKPRRNETHSDHIFQTRPGKPITPTSMSQAVHRYSGELGSKADPTWGAWRPHDLRRTARTGLSAAGVGEVVAELAIGHTRKGIAAVYDQHKYLDEKRKALEAWDRRILRIVDGEPADENVVPMTGRPNG